MDKNMRDEILIEINRFKRMMRSLEEDGELTRHERNVIMNHMGAVKAVLSSTGLKSSYKSAEMRLSKVKA